MAALPASPTSVNAEARVPNRWLILIASIITMVAVANYQYGWTFFVVPLQKHLNQTAALISVTFTVFVLLETWLVPFEGALVDRFGPRVLVMLGGVLAGLGWIGSGKAESLTALYLSYALSGIGAGIVYGTAVGSALKWFPDHRGLAAGLTAAGFGAGSALTVAPIRDMIASAGYQNTFIRWGIVQGIVVVVAAMFLKAPPEGWLPKTWRSKGSEEVRTRQAPVSFTSSQMAATPHFWLMYFMMVMVATGGLMATAQLAPMAKDFKVDNIPVRFLFWSVTALTFAAQADRVINGVCRPFWGWVSDHIGRENTMTLAFGLEAVAKVALIMYASHPLAFVLLTAFTFFGWGEIFSLFPALCGDFFGRKHATANYGFLYTAKGTASVFIPIGAALAAGKAFDFRADIMLLVGGLITLFVVFLGPTVFKIHFNPMVKAILSSLAAVIVVYALVVTVLPAQVKTPFQATYPVHKIGWTGVFGITIVFDVIAALLAFFVLKRLKAPELPAVQTEAAEPIPVKAQA
jgi:OFA family oxalate/formate antiporter-like MFS transporter